MINFAEVKQQYNIRAVAEQLGVKIAKHTARYDLAYCPFHKDGSPSLQIFDDAMHCHAGCLINGGEFADVLDFVKELYGCRDIKEAYTKLTGQLPEPPKLRELPRKEYEYHLSWWDVERGLSHQSEAKPYFEGRGIAPATIATHRMGKYVTWRHTVELAGVSHTFECGRYTIPDIAFGNLRNIELRLDESEAQRRLQTIPQALHLQAVAELTLTRGTEPTESDLVHFFFGAKYLRVPGGVQRNLIFNIESAIQKIAGGWFMRELPYLLIHEGGLKALATQDSCDQEFTYPSVGAKGAQGLAQLFNVKELIVVQDNEPDKVRNGRITNAGKAYAERAVAASGRLYGQGIRIVVPPDGFKAADDLVAAGQIHTWLGSLGIDPVHRTRFAGA